jgi:DNA-binding NtrC family response regulator
MYRVQSLRGSPALAWVMRLMKDMQSQPLILMIEPSDSVAAAVTALLEQHELTVERLTTISEVRTRDLDRYGVIVVDVRVEDGEAVSFLESVYRHQSHLTSRIVVVSVDGEPELRIVLEAVDICDIVPKPVNADDIVRAVLECLEPNPVMSVQ